MKVLLIHPEESRSKFDFKGIIENECLDLEWIATILVNEGHEYAIWDGKIEDRKASDVIDSYAPDAVFLTGRDFQENFLLEYARYAKEHHPKRIVIMGGIHAQLCYERLMHPFVDYVLKSFDFFKVPKLLELHGKKDALSILETMDDICYKKNEEWISNPAVPFDISLLPRPDRTYFYEHPDNYNYLELSHAAWVRTAFCCPYRCKFCMRNHMNTGRYTRRDIADVVDEIEEIKGENIYIVDDDFLYDEERLNTFIRLIREKGIKKRYICYGRSDFIATHEDIVKDLADIGFYYFLVGLETIRDKDIGKYNKRSTLKYNEESIRLCHKYGVHMMAMFILDLDFKRKDFSNLYKWIKKYELKHVAVSIYTPEMGLPESEVYRDRIISWNPGDYDYMHLVCKPDNLSVGAYYRNYYKLLVRLFLKAKKDGVYDFLDYGSYIKDFVKLFFTSKE